MEATATDLTQRIAQRVRALRAHAGLSLDALAQRSGVSRSAISLIERGETSATATVLDKLASALGAPLASLFDAPAGQPCPVARAAAQPRWRDAESGYVRRNVSPPGWPSPITIVEVDFPPRAHVAYDSAVPLPTVHQQIWVLDGTIEVTLGDERHRLDAGDCLAHVLDRPVAYRNPLARPARYAVVIVASAGAR